MSESTKKFEDLTKAQQLNLKIAGRRFVIKMFLNGVNTGGLIFMSNLILVLLDRLYFNSTPLLLITCIIADIYFFGMMRNFNKKIAQKLKDTVKETLETK